MKTPYHIRLRKDPQTFVRLTGITPEVYDDICRELKLRYAEWNEKRLSRPNRMRKIGGGNQFTLCMEDRFLMLLLYYRTYVTHVFLAFLFGISDSIVCRNINPLQPLLAGIFKIPERRIKLSQDEIAELFFDGTEQPTNRPKKGQRKWYSGKKKRHTIKHQIVVVRKRKKSGRGKQKRRVRIAAVSKSFYGRTHDKKMYEETRTLSPLGVKRKGDTGYLGTVIETPWKKAIGKELTEKQKRSNRHFSSRRVAVEHGIGKMKFWRIAAEKYRNVRHTHTLMLKNIAGLHNAMFA